MLNSPRKDSKFICSRVEIRGLFLSNKKKKIVLLVIYVHLVATSDTFPMVE